MRKSAIFLAAMAMGIMCPPPAAGQNAGDAPNLNAAQFHAPPAAVRPLYRWWLPLAAVDEGELRREIDEMANAGAGGVEVIALPVPGEKGKNPAFLHDYGFGTPRWSAALETIYEQAALRGLRVDLTASALWPTTMPNVSTLNDPAAQLQLVAGYAQVAAGQSWSGMAPLPEKAGPTVTSRLCAPAAARATRIRLDSMAGHRVGDTVTIGDGPAAQQVSIVKISPVQAASCPGSITVRPALRNAHVQGVNLVNNARRKIIALLAARCATADCPAKGGTRMIDPASVIDLTRRIGGKGHIGWTAPPGDTPWWLIAFYQTADGQKVEGLNASTPNYVVDHIGTAGARAVTDYYERTILTPRLRSLIRQAGDSALFEDSFEPSEGLKWTEGFLRQFQQRRGYALTPYLPLLAGGGVGARKGFFDYPDIGERVREDYRQTFSDLYGDHHIKPLVRWAQGIGMKTRMQIEGGPMEITDLAAIPDIPEGENRNFLNNPELWKVVGIGAQFREREALLSTECCPIQGGAWATTADGKPYTIAQGTGAPFGQAGNDANLNWVYKAYAGGVNQLVWHGFPYLATPSGSGPRSRWPGNSFGGNDDFSEAFGPRMPQWTDYRSVNDHLARLQLAMRQGRPRYDLAIFWHDFGVKGIAPNVTPFTGYPGLSAMPTTLSPLAAAGFTYQYAGPSAFSAESVRDVDSGQWLPERLGFKAILLNDQAVMPVESLRHVRDIAFKGHVPLIVVGRVPQRTPGLAGRGGGDAEVARIVTELKALANRPGSKVRFVADLEQAAKALAELAVEPAAGHLSDPASPAILSVRRHSADADYYLLFNQGVEPVRQTLALTGDGAPYELDGWTGEIKSLALYDRQGDRFHIPVEIGPNDVRLIAIGRLPGAASASRIHAVSTDARTILEQDGSLVMRVDRAGRFQARLSDGSEVTTSIDRIDPPVALDQWTLAIESWTSDGTGLPGLEHTRRQRLKDITVKAGADHRLPGWTELGHGDKAGVGTYATTLALPSRWKQGMGAWLDLGQVVDTFRITVNGTALPPANYQDASSIDISRHLKAGANRIEVRVATPLRNAVEAYARDGAKPIDRTGLLGPVTVRFFRDLIM